MNFLKRSSWFLLILSIGLICVIGSGGGGSDSTTTTDNTITFTAEVQNLSSGSIPGEISRTNISPSVYKIALVNFWFIKDDDTEVNILNPDSASPTYTETSPLIVDFSSTTTSQELLSNATLGAGTYTGYKMQFLYLEMRLASDFHLPGISQGAEFPTGVSTDILDSPANYDYRLYFDALGKYWKRDFAVELTADSDIWFWMRRQVENVDDLRNFFIAVADNTHPPGGAGSTSTIDLFNDPDFWGEEDDYDVTGNPIIVGTHSTVGGVSATLEDSFTIGTASYDITLYVDVEEKFSYGEEGTAPGGVTFTANVLDLGPSYGADQYGDIGLHPFVPGFSVEVE